MLAKELEHCLNDAFLQARKAGHGHLTVEHLLRGILGVPDVCDLLRACGGDPVLLKQELERHLEESAPPRLDENVGRELPRLLEVQPTMGFQRVLQRAVFEVRSSGKEEIGAVDVLIAIFREKQTHAVLLLNRHNITHSAVVNCLSNRQKQ